jgi:hypothetical protein
MPLMQNPRLSPEEVPKSLGRESRSQSRRASDYPARPIYLYRLVKTPPSVSCGLVCGSSALEDELGACCVTRACPRGDINSGLRLRNEGTKSKDGVLRLNDTRPQLMPRTQRLSSRSMRLSDARQ